MDCEPRLLTAEELTVIRAWVTASPAGSYHIGDYADQVCLEQQLLVDLQHSCRAPFDFRERAAIASLFAHAREEVFALLRHIAAQAALLAEARAALELVVQRYMPQITVITEGVGAAAYYNCVPAVDLCRAAEMMAKLKEVLPDGR